MPSQPKLNLNELHTAYLKDPLLVDQFAESLRIFVIKTVKKQYGCSGATWHTLEDAVGESLLEVWRRLESFNPEKAQFTTWVTMVVNGNIIDEFRKYNKRQEIELNDNLSQSGVNKIPDRFWLRTLIGSLDNDLDIAFITKKLEGLTEQELAVHFGQNPKWAKNKWHRLAEKLRLLAAGGG